MWGMEGWSSSGAAGESQSMVDAERAEARPAMHYSSNDKNEARSALPTRTSSTVDSACCVLPLWRLTLGLSVLLVVCWFECVARSSQAGSAPSSDGDHWSVRGRTGSNWQTSSNNSRFMI
jgi:hypothetical protein